MEAALNTGPSAQLSQTKAKLYGGTQSSEQSIEVDSLSLLEGTRSQREERVTSEQVVRNITIVKVVSFLGSVVWMCIGAGVYMACEPSWNFVQGLFYMVNITFGVGDTSFSPGAGGKWASIGFSFVSFMLIAFATAIFRMSIARTASEKMRHPASGDDTQEEATTGWMSRASRCCQLCAPALLLCVWMCGGFLFGFFWEGWSFTDSCYFAVLTLSTFGGELPTSSDGARLCTCFYIATGVPIFVYTIAVISEGIAGLFQTYAETTLLDYGLRDSIQAAAMDTDRDGQVRWDEYLEAMLLRLGYCDPEQLEHIREKFEDVRIRSESVHR